MVTDAGISAAELANGNPTQAIPSRSDSLSSKGSSDRSDKLQWDQWLSGNDTGGSSSERKPQESSGFYMMSYLPSPMMDRWSTAPQMITSPVATPGVQSTSIVSASSQISELSQRLILSPVGGQEFIISLSGLGKIHVAVSLMSPRTISYLLSAEEQRTNQWLEQNQSKIRKEVSELNGGHVEVDVNVRQQIESGTGHPSVTEDNERTL